MGTITRLPVPSRFSSSLVTRALRARPDWQHTASRPGDRPSDHTVQLVAFWISSAFTQPDGTCEVSSNELAEATGLRFPACRAAVRVLMATGLIARPDKLRPTFYVWDVPTLEALAAGVSLNKTQLAKNESSETPSSVVAAPPRARAFTATVHISTPLAEGVCRRLGIKTNSPRTAAGLDSWIWENLKRWNDLATRIEEEAERAEVSVGEFARTLGHLFQAEDDWCIQRNAPVWSGLHCSHVWTRAHAECAKQKRARDERQQNAAPPRRKPPVTSESLTTSTGLAADLFGSLEEAAAAAERGVLPKRAAGGMR